MRSSVSFARLSISIAAISAIACSSGASAPAGGATAAPGSNGDPGASAIDGGSGSPDFGEVPDGSTGPAPTTCAPNPANFDVPGNGCDDDGNGKIDDAVACDGALLRTASAEELAQAIGLCQRATASAWGVVSAQYVNGYAQPDEPPAGQHGVLPSFGALAPREGDSLAVLSTGWARLYDQASGTGASFRGTQTPMQAGSGGVPIPNAGGGPPPGFPKPSAGCPTPSSTTYDMSGVRLVVKAPANAKGLRFDFDFLSGEWPEYVCSPYNDAFIAYLSAKGFNGGRADNVSFDAVGNPVSVNMAFFDRCTPGAKTGCRGGAISKTATCPGGSAELVGTGFYALGGYCTPATSTGGGATGWLQSIAPVQPGETITIDFLIWDTGDPAYDSSVLLDHFTWIPADAPPVKQAETVRPPPK